MDYFCSIISSKGSLEAKNYDNVLKSYSKKYNTLSSNHQYYKIDINKVDNHFFCFKDNDHTYYLFGRDFKSYDLKGQLNESVHLTKEFSFPFLVIKFNEEEKSLSIETDRYGLYKVFYIHCENHLFITNNLYIAAMYKKSLGDLSACPQAYFNLLRLGYNLPYETPYKDIFSLCPLKNLTYSYDDKLNLSDKENHTFESTLTYDDLESVLSNSINEILNTSPIKWIHLTGGLDTRLILSFLTESQRNSFQFYFDSKNGSQYHRPYDQSVLKKLKNSLNLNVSNKTPIVHTNPFPKPFHRLPTEFSPFNNTLTGMYGGEIFGTLSLDLIDNRLNSVESHCSYQNKTNQELDYYTSKMSSYSRSSHDLFFKAYTFLNSTSSRIYDDSVWTFPYSLSQKKITPFINLKLLDILFQSQEAEIKRYGLYSKFAQKKMLDLLKYPINSCITDYHDKNFIKENSKLEFLFDETKSLEANIGSQVNTDSLNDLPFSDKVSNHHQFFKENLFSN